MPSFIEPVTLWSAFLLCPQCIECVSSSFPYPIQGSLPGTDNVRRSLITTWPLICICILRGRVCLNFEKKINKNFMIKSLGPCKESDKMLCFLSVDGQPEFLGILIFP